MSYDEVAFLAAAIAFGGYFGYNGAKTIDMLFESDKKYSTLIGMAFALLMVAILTTCEVPL